MKWIDREKAVYKTIAYSHYGAWPRLEEITETYNLAKDIEDTYCKCDLELARQIAEKIEEEKKMKNIKWEVMNTYYDPRNCEYRIGLRAVEHGPFRKFNTANEIVEYVNDKLNSNEKEPMVAPFARDIITTTYHPDRIIPEIKDVIFNGPATIVLWKDGTKTVVKAQEGEIIDCEKGMAMAIAKRMLGNKGNYYDTFTKYLPKEEA